MLYKDQTMKNVISCLESRFDDLTNNSLVRATQIGSLSLWPIIEDKVSLKLENISTLNQLAQGRAHDAMVDVNLLIYYMFILLFSDNSQILVIAVLLFWSIFYILLSFLYNSSINML